MQIVASRARTKRRQRQLEFLLTIDEPLLGPIYKDDTGLSLTGITMTILNHGRSTSKDNNGNTSLYSIITFMRDIQQYLPYDLRPSDRKCRDLWSRKQSVEDHKSRHLRSLGRKSYGRYCCISLMKVMIE